LQNNKVNQWLARNRYTCNQKLTMSSIEDIEAAGRAIGRFYDAALGKCDWSEALGEAADCRDVPRGSIWFEVQLEGWILGLV
jgi:hypothetical protein